MIQDRKIAVLGFVVFAFSFHNLGSHGETSAPAKQDKASSPKASRTTTIEFELLQEGKLGGEGIVSGSYHEYEAKDGVFLQKSLRVFASPSVATNQMQALIRRATKTFPLERNGQSEEKMVVLWRRWRGGTLLATVVWTEGPALHTIESESLEHVLQFEKQIYAKEKTKG